MTASNFAAAMDFIWGPDRDGARHDNAPGETFDTVRGVTQMTWDAAVEDGIVIGDLADATDAALTAIYRVRYWNAAHCSSLPSGVDLMVFQQATLSGVGHMVRLLQRIVGATVDGAVETETLRKTNSMNVHALIDAIVKADLEYLSALGNARMFIRGWTRREHEAQALAYRLARIKTPEPTQEMKMSDEQSIETEIQAKGLNAPRLNPAMIDATIVGEDYHVFPGTTMTVCALTLRNGYIVTGESAAASPENFDAELGRKIARGNARNKIWALEGYALRERLSAQSANKASQVTP